MQVYAVSSRQPLCFSLLPCEGGESAGWVNFKACSCLVESKSLAFL